MTLDCLPADNATPSHDQHMLHGASSGMASGTGDAGLTHEQMLDAMMPSLMFAPPPAQDGPPPPPASKKRARKPKAAAVVVARAAAGGDATGELVHMAASTAEQQQHDLASGTFAFVEGDAGDGLPDKQVWGCPECNAVFKTRFARERHVQNKHRQERRFVCGVEGCEKAFFREVHCIGHRATHTCVCVLMGRLCESFTPGSDCACVSAVIERRHAPSATQSCAVRRTCSSTLPATTAQKLASVRY